MAKKVKIELDPKKMKSLDELCKDFSATQILYLLGETLLRDIDKKANIQYDDCEEPHHLIFKMESGRILTVMVSEIKT